MIKGFLQDKSPYTVKAYLPRILKFKRYIRNKDVDDPYLIQRYVDLLAKNRKLSPASYNVIGSTLTSCSKYCGKNFLFKNKDVEIDPIKYVGLTDNVKQFLDWTSKQNDKFAELLMQFIWETACRVQDVCQLEVGRFIRAEKKIILPGKKVKKTRILFLSDKLCRMLEDKIDSENLLQTDYLITKESPAWVSKFFTKVFEAFQEEEEVSFHLTAHYLRHARLTSLSKNNCSTKGLMSISGHKKVDNIMRYIHEDEEAIKRAMIQD